MTDQLPDVNQLPSKDLIAGLQKIRRRVSGELDGTWMLHSEAVAVLAEIERLQVVEVELGDGPGLARHHRCRAAVMTDSSKEIADLIAYYPPYQGYKQGRHVVEDGARQVCVLLAEIERLQRENDQLTRDCNDKDITIERLRAELNDYVKMINSEWFARVTYKQQLRAALRALGGEASLEAKIGALLIGRGFYDRMKDQTDEDTAARIVYEFLAVAGPIVSAHYGRTQPPGAGQ